MPKKAAKKIAPKKAAKKATPEKAAFKSTRQAHAEAVASVLKAISS